MQFLIELRFAIIAETITFYDDLYEFLSAAPISRYISAFYLAHTRKLSRSPPLAFPLSHLADFLCRPSLQAVPNAREARKCRGGTLITHTFA